ncbi:MAG: S8 family peptidase [Thermoguttaceae bacterium]
MKWVSWVLFCGALFSVCAASSAVAQGFPNDTYYSTHQWYGPVMRMPDAWAISTGSSSVTVAVLDTGVISTTPDLEGRILSPLSAVPGLDPATDEWMMDTNYNELRRHGTWVASTVAMGINNIEGGAGVGEFSILPIRIMDDFIWTTDSYIASGIYMAADNGAKVINISCSADNYSAINEAAAYARSKGALTFIGAGNSDSYRNIADYANLIFVSGTDKDDARWSDPDHGLGSSYGSFVDIAAPAEQILVADPTTEHGYGLIDGTSFSTAFGSGAAALAWSINPNLTPDEVENLIFSTAVDLGDTGRDEFFGYGRIALGALTEATLLTVPEPVPEARTLVLLLSGIVMLSINKCRRKQLKKFTSEKEG